ncbi:HAD superfamily (Subfamily IG) hydrolase, 5'-Nucleotidase [Labilithrix luteola]|uniref:HAD superfamily (Subfamily IG) hydrolase, 5'-Nucleotidase n=1 Tax=Labilithrix luteola TaxID=1391654 RepID=A0A0K1QDH6_9BACT|nr:HAD-IG family 5'-nucleotidase [Labilithrix luteola]AKV03814.1 HAD superfamily (Subfamily IG) hydrolase, 5'-Nucleotidase [Labilithrix luteola]
MSAAPRSEPPPHTKQLPLPLDDFGSRERGPGIARQDRVFCNRNLKMSGISWVGFDMDYTLAIYDQPAMDDLSIRATIAKLIARGYPEFIKTVPVSTQFPVRGLLIDKRFGHVLKMDRYKHVHKGYHGFRELTKEELRALYHAKKIRPATPRYHWIDTLYALSEVATYAALVDAMEKKGYAVDYSRLFTDIRECIDEAHRDGTILDEVAANLPHFVHRDPNLAPTLHKLRSSGKKLFLLTNSRWAYTEKMMTYLLGGAMAEYPTWRNFFDVVIVAATKPIFFTERRPLLERDGETLRPVTLPLERGKIYEGGNLQELERALGVTGDEILYVGDHIYGDILRSKKDSAWRTAMIMQELETEIAAYESCKEDFATIESLDDQREHLEDDLRYYQARIKELTRQIEHRTGERLEKSDRQSARDLAAMLNAADKSGLSGSVAELEADRMRFKRAVERIRGKLRQIEAEVSALDRRIDLRFHPYWGSLLKEGSEQSSFGKQVDDYACLYTSRVSNFLAYSPQQSFRSPRDVMAHEIGM